MSASPTTHITRIALAIACTIVASLAGPGAAWATSPTITTVDGNPTCASVGAGTELYKAEPVATRSFSRGSFSGRMTVSGRVFDFTTAQPVDVVIVKGGDNANVYRYTPETSSGSGLHAPVNPSNGQYYGLSHVSFCQDFAPPPPPPPCTPGGSDMKADGTPCNPPPCTPGGSDMKADGTPCNPPPCTPGGSDKKADGTPCNPPPPPPPPCTPGGSDMKADGTPCNPPPPPPPPCTPGGSDMKADGTPCNPPPPPPPPCTPGGADVKADGTPCTPPPPPPVQTVVPSQSAPKQGGVLGVVRSVGVRAAAAMQGPRRCVTRAYTQRFRGSGIRRITVRVNGRVVRRLSGRGTVRIDPRRYRGGVMRIQARVEYVASSGRRAQTLRATVLRCAVQQTGPQFTG